MLSRVNLDSMNGLVINFGYPIVTPRPYETSATVWILVSHHRQQPLWNAMTKSLGSISHHNIYPFNIAWDALCPGKFTQARKSRCPSPHTPLEEFSSAPLCLVDFAASQLLKASHDDGHPEIPCQEWMLGAASIQYLIIDHMHRHFPSNMHG